MKTIKQEPALVVAAIIGLLHATLIVVMAFTHFSPTGDQTIAMEGLFAAISGLGGVVVRSQVTPIVDLPAPPPAPVAPVVAAISVVPSAGASGPIGGGSLG